jgi:hypothetical protein
VLWSPGSRYLSYLRGGGTFGESSDRLGRPLSPYTLYVCDLLHQRNYRVMKDAGLAWSWTYHGQLLFGHVPQEQFEALSQRQVRPSVYVADASKGEPKKIFDGGYFANESPDGQWIAFCDWPGKLLDATDAPRDLQDSQQRGLFLFHKPTGKRVFVGDLKLPANGGIWMQWSPDGASLYLLEHTVNADGVTGTIYKINVGKTPSDKPLMSQLTQILLKPEPANQGGFAPRGTSPDGRMLYLNAIEWRSEPKNSVVSTLMAIDTRTGKQTAIARMTNVNNENPDWDWRDDSGVNPAFAAAEKIEAALPVVREGNKDADPKMQQPAMSSEKP